MLNTVVLVKSHVSGMGMRFAGYRVTNTVYYVCMQNCAFSAVLSQAIDTPVASNSYNVVSLTFEWRYIPNMTTKRFNNIFIFTLLTIHGLLINYNLFYNTNQDMYLILRQK